MGFSPIYSVLPALFSYTAGGIIVDMKGGVCVLKTLFNNKINKLIVGEEPDFGESLFDNMLRLKTTKSRAGKLNLAGLVVVFQAPFFGVLLMKLCFEHRGYFAVGGELILFYAYLFLGVMLCLATVREEKDDGKTEND